MKIKFEVKIKDFRIFTALLDNLKETVGLSTLNVYSESSDSDNKIIERYYNVLKNLNGKKDIRVDMSLVRYLINDLSNKIKDCTYTITHLERNDSFSTLAHMPEPYIQYTRNKKPYGRILDKVDDKKKTTNLAKHKFKDVIGMDKVKDKLYDVIDQFKNAEKYKKWGVKPIKAILLYGAPGTGKTYISEALANEIDAYFEQKNISDIFQKYIGESEKMIRDLFEEARNREGNTVIFIDEIDSVAKKRNSGENAEARNSILNELLSQMSNSNNEKIFLIFATNMLKLLDPAFLRSGRVDFKIEVPLPDINARKGILEMHSKKRPMAEDVDLYSIAKDMSGRNCADVELVANEAARRALKAGKEYVEQIDFINAFEEQVVGEPDKDRNFEELERKLASVHEVGHLITNRYLCAHRTVKRISILPRGGMLGFVHYEDTAVDKYLVTKEELINNTISCLAGRAAEEVFYGKENVTTGASNDIETANAYIRSLVTEYGMDDEFGFINLHRDDVLTEAEASKRVKVILDDCYNKAKEFIEQHKDMVAQISEILLDKEELDEEELDHTFDLLESKNVLSN